MTTRQKAEVLVRQHGYCGGIEGSKKEDSVEIVCAPGHRNHCPCVHVCSRNEGSDSSCLKCAEEWLRKYSEKCKGNA